MLKVQEIAPARGKDPRFKHIVIYFTATSPVVVRFNTQVQAEKFVTNFCVKCCVQEPVYYGVLDKENWDDGTVLKWAGFKAGEINKLLGKKVRVRKTRSDKGKRRGKYAKTLKKELAT